MMIAGYCTSSRSAAKRGEVTAPRRPAAAARRRCRRRQLAFWSSTRCELLTARTVTAGRGVAVTKSRQSNVALLAGARIAGTAGVLLVSGPGRRTRAGKTGWASLVLGVQSLVLGAHLDAAARAGRLGHGNLDAHQTEPALGDDVRDAVADLDADHRSRTASQPALFQPQNKV